MSKPFWTVVSLCLLASAVFAFMTLPAVGDDDAKEGHCAHISGKIVAIGPDGKKKEITFDETTLKECKAECGISVNVSGGKIVIIGPDGKRREYAFGDAKRKGSDEDAEEEKRRKDDEDDDDDEDDEDDDDGDDDDGDDDDGDDEEAEKPRVQVHTYGKAIVIGPDGKTRGFEFGRKDGGVPARHLGTRAEHLKRHIRMLEKQIAQLKKQLEDIEGK